MALRFDRKYNRRYASEGNKSRELSIGIPTFITERPDGDNRLLAWCAGAAVVIHLVLFAISFPTWQRVSTVPTGTQKVFKLEQVRFRPPEPQQAQTRPTRQTRKIPIPDPTPDEPEPIVREQEYETSLDIITQDFGDLGEVPEAPPVPGVPGIQPIGGDVKPPIKIDSPQPPYTEEARQARIQGVVIMRAVVDILGNVTHVTVLKGLPNGLERSAVDTVTRWKFKPATLNGDPVPVYYNFTVNFTLQ